MGGYCGIVGGPIFGGGETWSSEVPVLEEVAVQTRLTKLKCSKTGEEPHPGACFVQPTPIGFLLPHRLLVSGVTLANLRLTPFDEKKRP